MTTLYLVAQGVEVVKQGQRRWVDPHWFRGQSYLKIGWNWVKLALSRGMDLITTLHLSSECDPEPAMASKRQYQQYCQTRFAFEFQDAAYRMQNSRFVSQSGTRPLKSAGLSMHGLREAEVDRLKPVVSDSRWFLQQNPLALCDDEGLPTC